MDAKTRMLKAWRFEEPDVVPFELVLSPDAQGLPGADEIADFIEKEAVGFSGVPLFEWGFLGLDTEYTEDIIEDVPGQYRRLLRTQSTPVGDFTAVTKHRYEDLFGGGDPNDFHWEKRYIETVDDLKRIATAQRTKRPYDLEKYNNACRDVGRRGLPSTAIFHPLGRLVRNSNMTEVYAWMIQEEEVMLQYLESCIEQISDTLLGIKNHQLEDPPVFMTAALEMLIPPWFGPKLFEKFVFLFDKRMNDAIHAVGGRHRAHCHGNSGAFIERFAQMGIDGLEPLEPPPYGDNDLCEAKRLVGDRMLLAGNIPSQKFHLQSFKITDVRDMVKKAIDEGAPGGGFFLKTTGGHVGYGKNREQRVKSIQCTLAMIEAWREFGR